MPNLFTNYLGKTIEALGPHAKAAWRLARSGGDFVLSNKVARYSTMAAGAGVAYYGHKHNNGFLEAAGIGALGGVGFGSAYRGHFGPTAQGYARGAVSGMKGAYNKGVAMGSRMRRGGRGGGAWAWGDNGAASQRLLGPGTGGTPYAEYDPYLAVRQAAMRGRMG